MLRLGMSSITISPNGLFDTC
uniref:Uncharacterized protein n=1 Tax=Anguilla anguilla TaxID=7936 RepID=A0A0E9QXW0_ANGAN